MIIRKVTVVLILVALLAPVSPTQVTAQESYVLGPDDAVEVLVFGNPEVSRTGPLAVTVRPDGKISLPLVGEVIAAGLTPEQLRQKLITLFAAYLRNPQVTVIVRDFRRLRVSVLGQVMQPGVYALAPGATVLDALASARGLVPDAGLGDARLIRTQGPAVVIDLEQLLLRGQLTLNLPLENGDVLMVPEDASARIYVLGEVVRPGVFPLRGPVTALQAMTLAGGPTHRAMLNRASVLRRGRQSSQPSATVTVASVVVVKDTADGVRVLPVDLWKVMQEGDVARDLPLQRGDVLYIPENVFALDNIALLLGVGVNAAFLLGKR